MELRNSGERRSSASRLNIQSLAALSTANCFCFEKPGQALVSTRAPDWAATSRVLSEDSESITRISSAHETDSQAARMLSASFSVMIVAVIFIPKCQKPDRQGGLVRDLKSEI